MASSQDRDYRTKNVSTRLTDSEYKRWEAAAKAAGREKVAQWNRETIEMVLEAQDAMNPAEGSANKAIAEAVRKRATNMNRAARLLESLAGSVSGMNESALSDLEKAVAEATAESNG